jgi:ABC-type multidrug transport system ATPase subunit
VTAPAASAPPPAPRAPIGAHASAVDIDGVVKRFGPVAALKGVSFRIARGSVFGLLGPNGAGKTTLLSIVAGFLRPTAGKIEVLGIDIRQVSALRGRLSILPQDAEFMANVPLVEQLVFFSQLNGRSRREAEREAAAALDTVGLAGAAREDARVLSHGMSKRLGIAQAFLGEPEVILLDEPTAGLDPAAAARIREVIARLKSSATLVISSHDLAEIQRMCDSVAILDHGELVEHDTVAGVTRADEVIRLTFARPLTDDERAAMAGVAGVLEVTALAAQVYALRVDPAAAGRGLEPILAELVGRLLPTCAVPRRIEEGVALEDAFLAMTRGNPRDRG